ncbi:MAG: glycosyltransferase, partial [Rhodothermales bacterium]
MARPPRILFAGGGTGGHVYPAIAIADAVSEESPEAEIRFAGTRDKIEWEVVPRAGYRIAPITISGLHRGQPLRNLTLPFKLVKSYLESRKLVREFNPDVAVGTGGYVSGPVLLAASLRGKPIVIQEQNAYAGLTNRFLSKRAERIHVAFLEAKDFLPSEKCVYSGNPTRRDLTRA